MPDTASQHRTDLITHRRSRAPSRRLTTQACPHANHTLPKAADGTSTQLSAMVEAGVLTERARIAHELHDNVAQTLYAIGLVAGRALTLAEVQGAEPIERAFDQVLQLASDAQAEVRTLLGTVWADEPQEVSFSEGLKALAANQERYHGLQVRVAVASEHESVPPDTAQLLLAIAREALSNVVRHAGAKHVDVAFETSALNFTLVIADDGRGFDPAVARPGHFGIRSMRERARALGAHVQVTSAAGAGTRLQVCVPRKRSAGEMPIRVLIADDHAVVRQGLHAFLETDPELEVVGEAADGHEAVSMAHRLRPLVVLMDLAMPGLDGIAATQVIKQNLPDIQVVGLTSALDDASMLGLLRAGAIGYLLKDTRAEDLREALKAAAVGQVQLAPTAAARLMREVVAPERPKVRSLGRDVLSQRELDVLQLLAQGQANKEIARELTVAEKTVKTHVSNILSKLGLRSRTQAALYAGRAGVVPIEELGRSA